MPAVTEEQVLCIRRAEAWTRTPEPQGLVTEDLARLQAVIRDRSFFMPRREVEEDPTYLQIISFVVFRHQDRYFLTRRLRASTERRLRQRYSLGVGGHLNPGDTQGGDVIEGGMRREWEEEVSYRGEFEARLLGVLNDSSAPVSRVHLGLVFLVDGSTPEISVREVKKLSGELLTLEEMRIYYLDMEGWSQLVYDRLAGAEA
ncbi:MAG: NUDIX domain-containing protein [Candidatus Dormibacteraeota bacterium]|nr:NUDIX domain-containing protein [Candidatus Dormibacteraeota bacterium]